MDDHQDFVPILALAYLLAGAFAAKTRVNPDWTSFSRPTNRDLIVFLENLLLWPFWSLRQYGMAWIVVAGVVFCASYWIGVFLLYAGAAVSGPGPGRFVVPTVVAAIWVALWAFGAVRRTVTGSIAANITGSGRIGILTKATIGAINHNTGRQIVAAEAHGLARAWQASSLSYSDFRAHPAFGRFEAEIGSVARLDGTLRCFRGRTDAPENPSIDDFGPPPPDKVSEQRYSDRDHAALYLSDAPDGVVREIGAPGVRVAIRAFQIPCGEYRIANFADLGEASFLAQVFWLAEQNEKGGSAFSRWIGREVGRQFDGMLVRGVRGENGALYQNLVILSPDEKWRAWIDADHAGDQ